MKRDLASLIPVAILAAAFCLSSGESHAAGNIIEVDSLADDGSGGCTLREAVESANTDTAVGGCAAGSATYDEIRITKAGTINLESGLVVTGRTNLQGPDDYRPSRLVIRVKNGDRALSFDSPGNNVSFYINDLTLGGSTTGSGGGIYVAPGDMLTMNYCIVRNCSSGAGGALFGSSTQVWAYYSLFTGNETTANHGGAIYNANGWITLSACVFSGNAAAGSGGAVAASGNVVVRGCTFAGNRAGAAGGGLFLSAADTTIGNSILWGNRAAFDPQISLLGGTLAVTYSDLDSPSVWAGAGNVRLAPGFVRPRRAARAPTSAGDYHLRHTSPCVNIGDPAYLDDLIYGYDLDGERRGQDGLVDMGADEAGPPFNESFEYGGAVPAPWRGSRLDTGDGQDCTTAFRGRCSFRFAGSAAAKSLRQVLHLSGKANDQVTVYARSRSQGAAAGRPYRVTARLRRADGSHEDLNLVFTPGTHGWQTQGNSLMATGDFKDILLLLRYAGQTGRAWFDDIQVAIYSYP